MKRKKRLFGIVLIITALLIMQLPVAEADAATSASHFKMEGNTLVKYRGAEKSVSIPNTVEVIAGNAFAGNTSVELIVIPDSVKRIDAYAFWDCENLEKVILGKGLTEVGDYVFANCMGLKYMDIPSNIRSIGIQAFADCVNLTDIDIAPEVTNIHESAFDGCWRLTIHCEDGTIADKFAEEFYEKQKEMPEYEDVSAYQPDKDTDNKDSMIENVPEPEVPEDTTGTFLGATQIVGNQAVVFVDNTSLQVLDGKEQMAMLQATGQEQHNTPLAGAAKYTIVDGKIVADQAYYRNQTIQNVVLPQGIEEVGQFSFARSSISRITIPEGTKWIGYGAFYHCDGLVDVILPTTIENVEPQAFTYTPWVTSFYQNTEADSDFLISGGVLVAYRGNSNQVTIPDGVRVIAGEAFAGHAEISELSLPDSLVTIGEGAFENCKGLRTVYFGNQLRFIKDRAFAGCALTLANLPASVEGIGLKAFDATVQMKYGGDHIPAQTHELSAERLSNEAYRIYKQEQGESGVQVSGKAGATAHLESAARSYTLQIAEVTDRSAMEIAYARSMKQGMPEKMEVFELSLTDDSAIPITKLGKQLLQVTIPVSESMLSENLLLYTMDRNGQLEEMTVERVKMNGIDCFRFVTDYISQYGVMGNGTTLDDAYVQEISENMVSMSEPPTGQQKAFPYHWILSIMLLASGLVCVCWKR